MLAKDIEALFIERAETVSVVWGFCPSTIKAAHYLLEIEAGSIVKINDIPNSVYASLQQSVQVVGINTIEISGRPIFFPHDIIDANDMLSWIETHGFHASTVQGVQT